MSMSDLKFRHPDRIFPGTLRTCGRILSRNYSKFLSISIVLRGKGDSGFKHLSDNAF